MIDHSGLRKAAHISLALGFFTLSASAYALSCPGVEDRFFVRRIQVRSATKMNPVTGG
jgi:hypothetical protein